MSYLVFARKFRPQSFEEVVGQAPITITLSNAIKQDRIPQNFLLSGPRGVGKTSTARIIAKALNCVKGPTVVPCGKCVPCVEITQGNSLDVLEIDGASNRGIDEVRNLRESVKFKPVAGHFKIYIIDEVHMLTAEAFNALLKTLEEPPPHVKFIFATTESHKVPLTILSRCQRFNFKRIQTSEIVAKLEHIAKAEKIKYEGNVLFLIAKASDGSLRDGESLLDQLASFSEQKIKEEDVLSLLGLASEEIYFNTINAILDKDAAQIFSLAADLYDKGRDLIQFTKGLFEMFRSLLLYQCTDKAETLVEASDETKRFLKEKKSSFSRGELLLALGMIENAQNQMRRNIAPPRLLLETLLLKLLHLDGLKTVETLLANSENQGRSFQSSAAGSAARPVQQNYPKTTMNLKPEAASGVAPKPLENQAPIGVPLCTENISVNEVEAAWPRVIEYVKSKRMSNGIFLSESSPVEVSEGSVTLGFSPEFQFHKETLEKEANRKLVEESFEVVLGKKLRVLFVVTRPEKEDHELEEPKASASGQDSSKLPEIIEQAINIFENAKVIRKDT